MPLFEERRSEPRRPTNRRAVVVAPGLEAACVIADESNGGVRIRLDRRVGLPDVVQVVDIAGGFVDDVTIAWRRELEIGGRRGARAPLRGLVPHRLANARDAWLRAGGR
ncbi:MAG: PilZ domain-containing protein [Brevundimonas sp.]|nr:MAG: PilZ domain-containing protein [Brevundimonas sp.]